MSRLLRGGESSGTKSINKRLNPRSVAVGALCLSLTLTGCGSDKVPDNPSDPKLGPTDIATLILQTESACALDSLPTAGLTKTGGKVIINSTNQKVILKRGNTEIEYVVPRGVKVPELYVCTEKGSVDIIGEVETLGIYASSTPVIVDGKAKTVYRDNTNVRSAAQTTVNGSVTDFVLKGDNGNHCYGNDGLQGGLACDFSDVFVYGSLQNGYENDSNKWFLSEFDRVNGGTISHKFEF